MNLKKIYKSTPEFKTRTETIFLSAVARRFGITSSPPLVFRYFLRGTAVGAVFMVILGTVSVYADQKNVGPENLLYPLKRSQEVINLTLSDPKDKAVVHLKLAERRLEEIKNIREQNPESRLLGNLAKDLSREVINSLETINGVSGDQEFKELPTVAKFKTTRPNVLLPGQAKEETSPAGAASQAVMATSAPIEGEMEMPGEINESPEEKREKHFDRSRISICETWSRIIGESDDVVTRVVNQTPRLIERFEKKCRPIFQGILPSELIESKGKTPEEVTPSEKSGSSRETND